SGHAPAFRSCDSLCKAHAPTGCIALWMDFAGDGARGDLLTQAAGGKAGSAIRGELIECSNVQGSAKTICQNLPEIGTTRQSSVDRYRIRNRENFRHCLDYFSSSQSNTFKHGLQHVAPIGL